MVCGWRMRWRADEEEERLGYIGSVSLNIDSVILLLTFFFFFYIIIM